MDSKNIVLLGLKGSIIAFRRDTGQQLWSTPLKSTLSSSFVSVVADDMRVYAHTGGEFFCLDLFSGRLLWQDPLPGMGYGVGSVALPGIPSMAPTSAAHEEKRRQDAAAAAASSSSSGS